MTTVVDDGVGLVGADTPNAPGRGGLLDSVPSDLIRSTLGTLVRVRFDVCSTPATLPDYVTVVGK